MAHRLPWATFLLWAALVAIGWIALARCETLTDGGGRFLRLQVTWSVLALAAILVTARVPTRLLGRIAYPAFGVALVLLVAVHFFPPIHGARRWIRIVGFGFQPSEVAKLAVILALARYLPYRESHRTWIGLAAPTAIVVAPMLLILREPDLGTAVVFLPVFAVVLFCAGARRRDLVRFALIGLLVAPVLWTQMSREQRSRVTALFQQAGPGERALDEAYQLRQAKQMIALGDRWGSLVLASEIDDPADYRLPEARTDFIYCVVGERLGLPGQLLVLTLYGLLVTRALAIGRATGDPFSRLAAVGIGTMIGVQALVNTSMNLGLLPITGLSLPLMSYGGTGLLIQSLGVGVLLRIAIEERFEIDDEPFRFEVV